MNRSSITRPILRLRDGQQLRDDDHLAIEEPLEIRIGDHPLAITMRTPGSLAPAAAGSPCHDAELAAGFCLSEGIIEHPDEIESIEPCRLSEQGNTIIVTLTDEALARRQSQIACATREFYISSSCGICGKQSIERIERAIRPPSGNFTVSPEALLQLGDDMRQTQATFAATGGLHAAALATPQGKLLMLREDVGRHNAVDKVIGSALLTGQLPMEQGMLLVSGRASFELVQKAAMASIALLAAVGAPSSLAVDLAARLNMTLIGFLRDGRMNIYHGEHRLNLGD